MGAGFDYDKTNIAEHYDKARELPLAAYRLWADAVKKSLPGKKISSICDLGCGTGRFSRMLSEIFSASVVGVDPSQKMLAKAKRAISNPNIRFLLGSAESIPLDDGTADALFMSMSYHHIKDTKQAISEFKRVLRGRGWVILRNSTKQSLATYPWIKFFPAAYDIEVSRLPDRDLLIDLFRANGFALAAHDVVSQLFAKNYMEYFSKVSSRGLSSLKAISDIDFHYGCERFKAFCKEQPNDQPVFEGIDLFVFSY